MANGTDKFRAKMLRGVADLMDRLDVKPVNLADGLDPEMTLTVTRAKDFDRWSGHEARIELAVARDGRAAAWRLFSASSMTSATSERRMGAPLR